MWAGFGSPLGSVGGESRRGRSSRIERAAEIAARSAARCTLPLPVTAPAIATSASAPASSAKAPPSARISAWPDSSPGAAQPCFCADRDCGLPCSTLTSGHARVARQTERFPHPWVSESQSGQRGPNLSGPAPVDR